MTQADLYDCALKLPKRTDNKIKNCNNVREDDLVITVDNVDTEAEVGTAAV
jgi:hypothetical protein